MKRISSLAICLLLGYITIAQEEIRVQFINQYEEGISTVVVSQAGKDSAYNPDKAGFADISINAADPVTVSADGFASVSINAAAIKAKPVVSLHKQFTWKDLLNPMFYIVNGGLWLLLFIVFAETGLFAGFFLPGDSLLFVAGIYSSNLMHEFYKTIGIDRFENEWVDLFLLVGLVSLMGVIGNMLGYWFGKKIGTGYVQLERPFSLQEKIPV